jgi:hypothetical protein
MGTQRFAAPEREEDAPFNDLVEIHRWTSDDELEPKYRITRFGFHHHFVCSATTVIYLKAAVTDVEIAILTDQETFVQCRDNGGVAVGAAQTVDPADTVQTVAFGGLANVWQIRIVSEGVTSVRAIAWP